MHENKLRDKDPKFKAGHLEQTYPEPGIKEARSLVLTLSTSPNLTNVQPFLSSQAHHSLSS